MATMNWEGKVCKIRNMSVKGGRLPDGFEVKLDIDLDCDASWEAIRDFVAGGSSARVVMQSTLRGLETQALRDMATKVVKVHVSDIRDPDAFLSPEAMQAKRMDQAKAILAGIDPEMAKRMLEELAE